MGDKLYISAIPGTDGKISNYNEVDKPNWKDSERWDYVGRVIIKDGVTRIGDWAFRFDVGIHTVWIPGTVTSVGEEAF